MAVHHVGGLGFEDTPAFDVLNLTEAVDRLAQRVHDATEVAVADGHGEHFAGAAHFLAFLDSSEIAEDHHADLTGVKVERQAERAVFERQQLIGHATRQSRHVRNAITGRGDIAHFLGGGVARLVRRNEVVEGLANRGGIDGQFCHDHSFYWLLFSQVFCLCWADGLSSQTGLASVCTLRCRFCSCATTVLSVTSSPT